LCEYATKQGFDPLVAANWENLSSHTLERAVGPMKYAFRSSYKLAIMETFPELLFSKGWHPTLSRRTDDPTSEKVVPKKPRGYWKSQANRKKHLWESAEKMGLDPRVPESWENLDYKKHFGHLLGMTNHFNGSFKLTVVDAFPELKFSQQWMNKVSEETAKAIGMTGLMRKR